MRRRRGRKAARKGGRFMKRRGYASKFHAPKHFTEVIKIADLVSPASGSAPNGYNAAIRGSDIQNLSQSLVDVFKQFCITGIKLTYLPTYNNYPLVAGTAFIPKIYYAEDKASFTPPVAVSLMLQEDNLKILDSSKKWSHYIKNPRAFINSLEPAAANVTPVAPPARQIQWLTTDDLAGTNTTGMVVPHLHSSILVEPNNSNVGVTTGTLWARVYYACKDQR